MAEAPGGSIPLAQAQQERRLPCQRCLRRLARPAELDREETIACEKQVGHVLCDYCSKGRKPCLSVPASCKGKARRLVRLYKQFNAEASPANRMLVLNAAKELGKLMTTSVKKAEARVGGFTSGGPSSARRGGAGGVTLSDINNNLRLLVDGLRRLVELGSLATGIGVGTWPEGLEEVEDSPDEPMRDEDDENDEGDETEEDETDETDGEDEDDSLDDEDVSD